MDEHEELLQEWGSLPHHKETCFIKDGIIDPNRWSSSSRKLLFLLKEAYGTIEEKNGFDLRIVMNQWKGPKYKIWWTAAYWAYLVKHSTIDQIPSFPSNDKEYADSSEALLESAVVNVKKSRGKSASNHDDIKGYIEKDGELIKKQIEIISPKIVICGNTWDLAKQYLWPNAEKVYDRVWKLDQRVFIDVYHPANQYPNALNYYALGCLLQNSGILR